MSINILVTGGAGYIGSHACKALAAAGFVPVTYDNLSLGQERNVRWGPLVVGDTRDRAKVEQTIRAHDIRAVMHFAAFAYVGESVSDPAIYYNNNVTGTLGLLDGMRTAGCDKLVFSSTCAVYGEPPTPVIGEGLDRRPVNPYGRTKLICEDMIADFGAAYGLNHVLLRYFNASGADLDGELGEDREIETHLIPRALMSLQGHIDDFAVFGTDFDTPDGTAIRDYIHVADLAAGHVLALRRLLDGMTGGAIYNLGTGQGHSVAEVLQAIERETGRSLGAPRGGRRAGDPPQLVADARRANAELGFQARHSGLDTIVRSAWRWHQQAHPLRTPAASDAVA